MLAQFVVNESGRYEAGTLKILNSSNPGFTAAVKDALPRMKFSAAQIGGKKVQQLVQNAVSVPLGEVTSNPIEQSRGGITPPRLCRSPVESAE